MVVKQAVTRAFMGALLFVGMELATAAAAHAQDPSPAAAGEATAECDAGRSEHALGWGFDAGSGADAATIRYLHEHLAPSGCDDLPTERWLSYGAELRGAFEGALFGHVLGRAGYVDVPLGVALEVGIGAGSDIDQVVASGIVGLYWSVYVLDLGVAHQLPIADERPSWMGNVLLSARIYLAL